MRPQIRKRTLLLARLLLAVFLTLSIPACQSTPSQEVLSEPAFTPINEIRLSSGDEIELKFPYTEEFDTTLTILPDGNISLPLIGAAKAAGKTPYELQEELFTSYSKHLQHPELSVIVRSLYERKVYVGGAVNTPGLIAMPGRLSLTEAIMEAGGFNMEEAEINNVLLIRQNGKLREGYAFNLKAPMSGKNYEPVYLQPKDVIYVPRTTIVNVGQWVNQHFWDLIPRIGFGFGYQLNPDDD